MRKPSAVVMLLVLVGLAIIGGVYFRFHVARSHTERAITAPDTRAGEESRPLPVSVVPVTPARTEPDASEPQASVTGTAAAPQPTPPGQTSGETISDVEQASSLSIDMLPSAIALELGQVQPGITVGDWQSSHPSEKWQRQPYPNSTDGQQSGRPTVGDDANDIDVGEYCAVFTRTWQVTDQEKLIRKAVFVIPPPPPSMTLPEEREPDTLVKTGCTIARVYVEARGFEAEAAYPDFVTLRDELLAELTARFGTPSDEISAIRELNFNKSAPTWKWNQARIVIKLSRNEEIWNSRLLHSRMITLAYLPNINFQSVAYQDLTDRTYFDSSPEMFNLGIRTAALDGNLSQPLADIFQNRLTYDYPSNPKARAQSPRANVDQVVAALKQWLAVTKNLPPQKRAGALLAADCVLDVTLGRFQDAKSAAARKKLETVGVKIDGIGGGGYDQDYALLTQARDLDPNGPIGEAIMMREFSSLVWHDDLIPKQYPLGVDYVIAAGERYLSKPRNPALVPRVQYYVASAYCDRVAESEGAGDGDSEYPPPTPEQITLGVAARPLALKHYRDLLALDKTSKWALDAWLNSWRILARLQLSLHYPSFEV